MAAVDISSPDIAQAYERVRAPENAQDAWLLLSYRGTRDKLFLDASGHDIEQLKVYLKDNDVYFAALAMRGRVLLVTSLPEGLSGVRRARALVHSRQLGQKFRSHSATITISSPAELTHSVIVQKLHLDSGSGSLSGTASAQSSAPGSPMSPRDQLQLSAPSIAPPPPPPQGESSALPPPHAARLAPGDGDFGEKSSRTEQQLVNGVTQLELESPPSSRSTSTHEQMLTMQEDRPARPVASTTANVLASPASTPERPARHPDRPLRKVESPSSSAAPSSAAPAHITPSTSQITASHHSHAPPSPASPTFQNGSAPPTRKSSLPPGPLLQISPAWPSESPLHQTHLHPASPQTSSPSLTVHTNGDESDSHRAGSDSSSREGERHRHQPRGTSPSPARLTAEERERMEAEERSNREAAERLRREEQRRAERAERERLDAQQAALDEARRKDEEERARQEQEAREEAQRQRQEGRARERERQQQEMHDRLNKAISDGGTVLAGQITCQGGSSMLWKRRWFELSRDTLALFKSERDASESKTPVDSLQLSSAPRKVSIADNPEEASMPNSLKIWSGTDDDDGYLFYCDERDDKEVLMAALSLVLGA